MIKYIALTEFILMYVLIIWKSSWRVAVAGVVALLFVFEGVLPLGELPSAINWNVLLMICGTMLLVYYFIESKMPNLIAESLMARAGNVLKLTIMMSLFSGFISAFMDNVATVLMIAPVGLAMCKKLDISPVPMILAIAVSSNLQGAATLVGDTTSIMLGAYADMDFMAFFWMKGRPGIFFAVELGALATIPIIMFLFRRDKQKVSASVTTIVKDRVPTVMLLLMIVFLICASFIEEKPDVTNGVICMVTALITIALEYVLTKDTNAPKEAVKSIDFQTLIFLFSLFIVIGGVTNIGLIDDFAGFITNAGSGNLLLLYSVIVWGSVVISAFVDNIPYVATMLPVVLGITTRMGIEPYLLYFGLLCGATLGGNLTPIGASANITAVGLLKKEGHDVSFKDFARIGIPFTLAAVISGYIYLWIVWR